MYLIGAADIVRQISDVDAKLKSSSVGLITWCNFTVMSVSRRVFAGKFLTLYQRVCTVVNDVGCLCFEQNLPRLTSGTATASTCDW